MMFNIFLYVIIIAALVDFFLSLAADLLNLKALRLEPPPAFADIYEPKEYTRSQEYLRAHTYFEIIESTFTLAILLAMWFSGSFNYLDEIVRGWNFSVLVNGLIYIGILAFAYSVITLPFSIYSTFVIEQRFGFNKTTPRIFIADLLKGLMLGISLGGIMLAIVLALFQYAGEYAWLYGWGTAVVISLIVSYIAPNWIMPLFNKFTPMPQGELRDSVVHYINSVNFPVKDIFVIDGSKRSSKSNAFFTGFGKNKRIALYDTLIAQHTTPEIVAIIGHEIGHYKQKHILQGMLVSILNMLLVFFLLSVFMNSPGLYQAFRIEQPSIYTGILFFGLLYTPLEMILGIGIQMLSRRNEYQADRFAVQTGVNSENLITALKKLAGHNLSNLTPHPFYVFLKYSHPPLLKRIRAIEKVMPKLLHEKIY